MLRYDVSGTGRVVDVQGDPKSKPRAELSLNIIKNR